jgi:hypothetical protein
MKKLYLIIIAAAAWVGCKKSGNSPDHNNTSGLSGKYAAFKRSDTVFKDQVRSHGVSEIQVITLFGDTIYQNLDTAHPYVGVNIIQNYSPSMITDTLNFTSAGAGVESNQNFSSPFTYSIASGKFDNGDTTPGLHSKIVQIDATTVKLVFYETDGIYTGDVSATLFKKF